MGFLSCVYVFQLSSNVNGRNIPDEYWKDVLIVEQKSREAIGGLLNSISAKLPPLEKRTKNRDMSLQAKGSQEDHFDKDFEPRLNISVYEGDGVNPEEESKDSFVKDFEPRPNISVYQPEEEGKKLFPKAFDPRPSATNNGHQ